MSEVLDDYGRSGLHYAASEGNEAEVSRLIELGEDVNLPDRDKWTPLHFAAQAYALGVVRLLIDAGCRVDSLDIYGNTPLSTAVFNCQDQGGAVIAVLRKAGADPHAENDYGVSPYSLAKTIGNYDVARHFSDIQERPGEDT